MPIALAALRSRVPPVFTEIAVAPKVPPGVVVLRGLGGVLTEPAVPAFGESQGAGIDCSCTGVSVTGREIGGAHSALSQRARSTNHPAQGIGSSGLGSDNGAPVIDRPRVAATVRFVKGQGSHPKPRSRRCYC